MTVVSLLGPTKEIASSSSIDSARYVSDDFYTIKRSYAHSDDSGELMEQQVLRRSDQMLSWLLLRVQESIIKSTYFLKHPTRLQGSRRIATLISRQV